MVGDDSRGHRARLENQRLVGATAAFAGAMIGFLAVGSFDSLLDSPRMIFLFSLIWAAGLNAYGVSRLGPGEVARPVAPGEYDL